jgi:hypothetical protein
MADRKSMGCVTLFAVIVAALLFVFVALPAGCSTAGFLAMLGLAKYADAPQLNPPSVEKAAPRPKAGESSDLPSDLISALRERARWPIVVTVTRETNVRLKSAQFTLAPGKTFSATGMTPEGLLHMSIAGEAALVPFSDTDFVQKLVP